MGNGNKPEKTVCLGMVSAAIFANVRGGSGEANERVIHSVQLQRRYRHADGTWKTSTSFDISNLPAAIEALRLALAYLVERQASAAGDTA